MGRGGKGISHDLASQPGLTDRIRLGGGGDGETSNQVVSDHLLEDRIAARGTDPWEGGGRGEVGSLWDEDGGALEVGNGGGVDLAMENIGELNSGLNKTLPTPSE